MNNSLTPYTGQNYTSSQPVHGNTYNTLNTKFALFVLIGAVVFGVLAFGAVRWFVPEISAALAAQEQEHARALAIENDHNAELNRIDIATRDENLSHTQKMNQRIEEGTALLFHALADYGFQGLTFVLVSLIVTRPHVFRFLLQALSLLRGEASGQANRNPTLSPPQTARSSAYQR